MDKYCSPLLKRLKPYVPGEQPQDLQYIKLNTNENPYPPAPSVIKTVQNAVTDSLRLYPDPEARALKRSIAANYSVGVDNVFVGNGSDEVLALSFMAFFSEKSFIQFPDISYSFYPVYCNLFGVEARTVALGQDFSISFADYAADTPGIIFPNPNAPTGKLTLLTDLQQLLKRNHASLVIVDEAYIDFGGLSAVPLVDTYSNLLVIQTFSKSRSLAGMRIGYAIGNSALIDALTRVKNSFNSYPLDQLAQIAGKAAMEDIEYFNAICEKVVKTRMDVTSGLQALGFDVIPSQANFVFATHPQFSGKTLYKALKAVGILVRHFNLPRIDQYLRISIGNDEQMGELLSRLPAVMQDLAA